MMILAVLFGSLVGFSLGLTGGGGAIFAVPLLVYGLGTSPSDAVGISLLTVGCTSLVGFLHRARVRLVEFPTGVLFAVAGMIGAPVGMWLADLIPDALRLGLFSLLMVVIAARLWRKGAEGDAGLPVVARDEAAPSCRRDPAGKLHLNSRCAVVLALVGMGVGVLSGLFGVGGGFVIVPALVVFTGMGMQHAIGTSLLAIALISASGTASHLLAGKAFSLSIAAGFTAGSIAGLFAGSRVAAWFAGPTLQRLFAAAILMVAVYVIVRSISQ